MSDYKDFIKTDSYSLQSTTYVTPELVKDEGEHIGKWRHIFIFKPTDLEADSITILDHITNEEKALDITSLASYLPEGFYITGLITKLKIGSGKTTEYLAYKA